MAFRQSKGNGLESLDVNFGVRLKLILEMNCNFLLYLKKISSECCSVWHSFHIGLLVIFSEFRLFIIAIFFQKYAGDLWDYHQLNSN